MPGCLRVALLIESSRGYGRKLLQGIATYARARGPWVFLHEERDLGAPLPSNLAQWNPDGIIGRLAGDRLIRQVRKLGLPTVDLYHEDDTKDIPGIAACQPSLIRLAIDHFLVRGFKHFAYCGFPGVLFSDLRSENFQVSLDAQGLHADVFAFGQNPPQGGLADVEAYAARRGGELARWLKALPKPVALLACNDMRGQQIVTACAEAGIAVPDEVAVLGIDNDDVQCELANPPLSSIDPNVEQIGYEAAALLDRMIAGDPPPSARVLVEPCGVVTRRSTDVLAIANRDVAEAIRFVRERASSPGLKIEDLLTRLNLSRATLNRWFRKWLGRSPSAEITRVRLGRVQDLLATTALPLEEIAQRSGFQHVESMCRMVKRVTGQTPGELRRQTHSK
jgi:LacI family transcriptional regulator